MEYLFNVLGGILYVVLFIAALILIVFLLYRLIFKKYSRFLLRRYNFRLFNLVGGIMLLITGLYSLFNIGEGLIPFSKQIVGFFESLIFIGSPEGAERAATAFATALPFGFEGKMLNDSIELVTHVFKITLLSLPLTAIFLVNALIKTKSPLHALLSTFIMAAAAMIAGPVGAFAAVFILGSVITLKTGEAMSAAGADQANTGHERYRRRDPEDLGG